MLNYMGQFFEISIVLIPRFISETKTVAPNFFFAFLAQVTHYLPAAKI